MSNRSNGHKVEVLNILSDFTTAPGEHNYRVDIGGVISTSKEEPSTMNVFPQSNIPRWRLHLSIYFLHSELKNQYYVGQKFELIVKDTGELSLKPADKT
jgi:hypothetical protein